MECQMFNFVYKITRIKRNKLKNKYERKTGDFFSRTKKTFFFINSAWIRNNPIPPEKPDPGNNLTCITVLMMIMKIIMIMCTAREACTPAARGQIGISISASRTNAKGDLHFWCGSGSLLMSYKAPDPYLVGSRSQVTILAVSNIKILLRC